MTRRARTCIVLAVLTLALVSLTSCQEPEAPNTMGRANEIENDILKKLLSSLDKAASVLGQVISRNPNQTSLVPSRTDSTSSPFAVRPSGRGQAGKGSNKRKRRRRKKKQQKGPRKWGGSLLDSDTSDSSDAAELAPSSALEPQDGFEPSDGFPPSSAAVPADQSTFEDDPSSSSSPSPAPHPWLPFVEVEASLSSLNDTASAAPLPEGAPRKAAYDVFFIVLGRTFNGHMAAWAVQMAGEGGRVHIIADDEGTISSAKQTAKELHWQNFVVGIVRDIIGPVRDDFTSRYIHSSINPAWYEAMCFWRWGVIHYYMQALEAAGMELGTIFTIDADVLPVRPYSKWIPSHYAQDFGRSISLFRIVNGAAAAWTRAELDIYWSFLKNVFSSAEVHDSFAKNWGQMIGEQLHFSDMHAEDAFVTADPGSRKSALLADSFQGPLADAQREQWNGYDCAPLASVAGFQNSYVTLTNGTTGDVNDFSVTSPKFELHLPFCFLHFWGHYKSSIVGVAEFLWRHINGSTYSF